jgi:RNA polymerase sigma-70 factor, ECF subfamily
MIGPSFDAVLAAAARGDDEAFGSLWRDLHPGLLRYLNAMAPGAGEDLASKTWLRVGRGPSPLLRRRAVVPRTPTRTPRCSR